MCYMHLPGSLFSCFPTRVSHPRPPLAEAEVTLAPCSVCAEVAQYLPPLTQSLHACWCEMQSHSLLWIKWPEWSGRGSYSKELSHEPGNKLNESHKWVAQHLDWRNVIQQGKKHKNKISHFIWQRSILGPSVDIQHATCWGPKLVLD